MSATDAPEVVTAPSPVRKRALTRFVLLGIVPLLLIALASAIYVKGGRYVSTENAYVKADKVPISAEVSGPVTEVAVRENQQVEKGDLLFRIDPSSFEVALIKAEAKLAQVRTDLSALKASYREKQAEITLARTRQSFMKKDEQRQSDLMSQKLISASTFDGARLSTDLAQDQVAALEQDLHRLAEALGGSVDAPVERHPASRVAAAEIDQARLDLSRVEVRAPLPGAVSRPPKRGQHVEAGSTVMALVGSRDLWIEANFTETDLTYVHPGQPVTIHIDTFPDDTWQGEVESLSPATGAEFSILPAQNATGNWVKITQRVPVRIRMSPHPGQPPLRAGLSTVVEIDTGHRRRLFGYSF